MLIAGRHHAHPFLHHGLHLGRAGHLRGGVGALVFMARVFMPRVAVPVVTMPLMPLLPPADNNVMGTVA